MWRVEVDRAVWTSPLYHAPLGFARVQRTEHEVDTPTLLTRLHLEVESFDSPWVIRGSPVNV